ncbi:MAG TPA: hypothetical protein VMT56_00225 [Candidatus Bathyarchaeia archaeon]|nr:hypothetical protein [Candidatus Bathyarchaeia archaeon]
MSSPTSRSLKHLRDQGYLAAVVERWNPYARIRQDLFGVLDLVAVKEKETLGVQTTSGSNIAARIKKLEDSAALWMLRQAGWAIKIHGWRKNSKGRWVLREVDLS